MEKREASILIPRIAFSNNYMGVIGVKGVNPVIPTVTAIPIYTVFLGVM